MKQYDCVIIGAGISGLTLAYRLKQAGLQVALLERGEIGGLMRSRTINGIVLELGATTIAAKTEMLNLIVELGLQDQIEYPEAQLGHLLWHSNRSYALPRSLWGLLNWDLISFSSRLRILRALFSAKAIKETDPSATLSETVSAWLGSDVSEKVASALIAGIWGSDPKKLIFDHVFPNFRAKIHKAHGLKDLIKERSKLGNKRFFALREGNQKLCSVLAHKLSAQLINAEANGIERTTDSWQVKTEIAQINASQIVIASAARSFGKLFASIAPQLSQAYSELSYAALAVNHIALAKNVYAGIFGELCVPPGPQGLIGALFNSNIFASKNCRPHATLTFGGTYQQFEPAKFSSEETIQQAALLLLGQPCTLLHSQLWNEAIPQYDQYASNLRQLQSQLEAEMPGLYFCSSLSEGVGVADRVRHAEQLAVKVLSNHFK